MRRNVYHTIWTVGFWGGLVFHTLRFLGSVDVYGYRKEKFIPSKGGLLIIYRHPSLKETALIPLSLFPRYLFNQKFVPYSAPDKGNYYDAWWFRLFRDVCIPVERGNHFKGKETLQLMQKVLNEGRGLAIAAEGGRTRKGQEFKVLRNGKIEILKREEVNWEEDKIIIRRFNRSIGWLVKNTNAQVLLIWVENREKLSKTVAIPSLPHPFSYVKMTIGERIPAKTIQGKTEQETIEKLEDMMLYLGSGS